MQNPDWYESTIDKQIREAQERGAFDNLPGAGKPLPGLNEPDDATWWVRRYIEREGLSRDVLLPSSIQLRKEIDRLPDTLAALHAEQAVRDAVCELNMRIVEYLRAPTGPRVQVRIIDVEQAAARWRETRPAPPVASQPTPDAGPVARTPWWRRLGRR